MGAVEDAADARVFASSGNPAGGRATVAPVATKISLLGRQAGKRPAAGIERLRRTVDRRLLQLAGDVVHAFGCRDAEPERERDAAAVVALIPHRPRCAVSLLVSDRGGTVKERVAARSLSHRVGTGLGECRLLKLCQELADSLRVGLVAEPGIHAPQHEVPVVIHGGAEDRGHDDERDGRERPAGVPV
ncbi:MAG: hypothetical protein EBR82_67160, partial [Caulobacteraceae bacterium]|nr:hypothetical protein [Caulobacteraceae bacterium]